MPPVEMFIGLLVTGCVATLSPVLGGPAGADAAQKMADIFLRQTNGPRPKIHSWHRCTMQTIPVQNISIDTSLQRLLHASHVTGSNRLGFSPLSVSTRDSQNASLDPTPFEKLRRLLLNVLAVGAIYPVPRARRIAAKRTARTSD